MKRLTSYMACLMIAVSASAQTEFSPVEGTLRIVSEVKNGREFDFSSSAGVRTTKEVSIELIAPDPDRRMVVFIFEGDRPSALFEAAVGDRFRFALPKRALSPKGKRIHSNAFLELTKVKEEPNQSSQPSA